MQVTDVDARATCTGAVRGRARVHAGLSTKAHTDTVNFGSGRAPTAAPA